MHGLSRVTILTLDTWRDRILRNHGFIDAFIDLKNRENAAALPLLPKVCAQIDAFDDAEQLRAVIEGVFAGNIFDMGAEATAKAYLTGGPDFFAIRQTLAPRPWLVDDYDAAGDTHAERAATQEGRLLHRQRRQRFSARRGADDALAGSARVRTSCLAANERPTLNDMTIHDIAAWWPRVLEVEPSLVGLPIEPVSTGTGEPLIDLSLVSDELNALAADADLVILEGMGRGVESNLDASFNCDAMNLAMIKDTMIAKRNGGKLYDVICRFR